MSRSTKNKGTSAITAGLALTITRADLLRGLGLAQRVADRNSTMPMLANVLLKTSGPSSLVVAATDLNISITAELASVNTGEGGLTVGAKALHDLVSGLPDGDISLRQAENNYCDLASGRVHCKLVGMVDRDFPKVPAHADVEFRELDAEALRTSLERVAFSMCGDETRIHLNGVLIESSGGDIRVVSTDGHRLSKHERDMPGMPSLAAGGIIVPRKAVAEIQRLLELGERAGIAVKDPHIFVRVADLVLVAKLIQSPQFPPYEQILPTAHAHDVVVGREALQSALRRCRLMSTDNRGVLFAVSPGRLVVSSENPDAGHVTEEIEIEYAGEEARIGFNARYVIDILGQIPTDKVRIELNDDLAPGVIRPVDGEDYLGVVMPMRVT